MISKAMMKRSQMEKERMMPRLGERLTFAGLVLWIVLI